MSTNLPLLTASSTQTPQPLVIDLRQMVLKLTELAKPASVLPASIVIQLVEPWQRLITVIDQLRSPQSGWSSDIPKTPEMLTPYVGEEVGDVLAILQSASGSKQEPSHTEEQYWLLETLSPWLLWSIASSTYETMRFMEGLTVRAFQAEQGWQTGILRLATLLTVKTTSDYYQFDLATYQPPELLAPQTLLQSDDYTLCQQPSTSDELLQHFTQQLQSDAIVRQLMDGIKTEILLPGTDWQIGTLRLHLGFEFMTATEDAVVDWVLNTDSLAPMAEVTMINSIAAPESQPSTLLKPKLRQTDASWVQEYEEAIATHLLSDLLPQLPALWALLADTTSPDAVSLLVRQACVSAEQLQTALTRSSRNFWQQDLELDDLMRRLLWCWSSTGYEVMQFMGGILVNLLQSQSAWAEGTLRLIIRLKIQTPELDWDLDLVTGQTYKPKTPAIAADAVVRSTQSEWCRQPILIKDLHHAVQNQLDKAIPEMQLLLQGTSIDVFAVDRTWQPATIRLEVDFEFMPLLAVRSCFSNA